MNKPVKKIKKKPAQKVRKQIADRIDLMLDGVVYIVEYDEQGKIISKQELDGDAVLKALLYVLRQSYKPKTNKKP
jgi:hypothetical protein